jgi:hypothetical protein
MDKIKKILTQADMINRLRKGEISISPLTLHFLNSDAGAASDDVRTYGFDTGIVVSWKGKTAKFAVKCKALSTPKAFNDGLNFLTSSSLPGNWRPMLCAPFLNEEQLKALERYEFSGIDMCGNGVVIAPGKFAVFRSGGKNLFPSSALIKNVYRKNSSMAVRVFLVRERYETVQHILAEVNRRNVLVNLWNKKPMRLSTVSKVLKTLEQDLIVSRKKGIGLLQPDKLLEKLVQNYDPPDSGRRVFLKIPGTGQKIRQLLMAQSQAMAMPIIATGTASVNQYAVMQQGDILSVYCPCVGDLLKRLPGNATDRFPNLELLETEDETIYFDARWVNDFWWASPLQVYLELMAGDKRDRETAEQVKSFLLEGLKQQVPQ